MTGLFALVGVVLVLFYVGLFAVSTMVPSGALAAKSKLALIVSAVDASIAMIAGHLLLPWAMLPVALWVFFVALVSGGAAAAVLRWRAVPMYRLKGRPRIQLVSALLQVAVAVAIGVALLLL